MKLTLDWNCVIEVEEQRPQARHVLELVDYHRAGRFDVALLAASASENTRSKRFPGNAGLFSQRVAALGWQDLPLVPMPGVWGLTYWDYCFSIEDSAQFQEDIDALWQIIAPRIARNPQEYLAEGSALTDDAIQSEALSKWRNTWCDVISAYSHIHAGRDLFVTNNTRDFQDHANKLATFGMKHICTPEKALSVIAEIRGR